jgi:hypothetical protein
MNPSSTKWYMTYHSIKKSPCFTKSFVSMQLPLQQIWITSKYLTLGRVATKQKHKINNQRWPLFFLLVLYFLWPNRPQGAGPLLYSGFTITLTHVTPGKTPLDEWSARRRKICITTHKTHNRQTSMPPAGFQPAIPANERPQTHGLGLYLTMLWWIARTFRRPY